MPLINGVPIVSTSIVYEGYTLPEDAVPLAPVPVDGTVQYAGSTLPSQKAPLVKEVFDPTNYPAFTLIGNTGLPKSINISVNGEKILAESQIIDGVSVFEHISRKAYEIEFKIMIYDESRQPVFPQSFINNIWNSIWLPNTVQTVKNTYLNGININQIIIKSIKTQPRLGSKIVDMVIKAVENQPGTTIITPLVLGF